MPLDTTPLSPARRLLSLVAICAILALSLGLAQAIILWHPGPAKPAPRGVGLLPVLPKDAKPLSVDEESDEKIWQLTVAGKKRELHGLVTATADPPTSEAAHDLGLDILRELGVVRSRSAPGAIGGTPAVAMLGMNQEQEPVAVATVTIVEGHVVALFLSGNSGDNDPISAADLAVFEQICERSQVIVNGKPRGATPRRAPEQKR